MIEIKKILYNLKDNKRIIFILLILLGVKIFFVNYNNINNNSYLYLLGEDYKRYTTMFDFTYNALLDFILLFISMKIFNRGLRKNAEFIFLRKSKFKYVIDEFKNIFLVKSLIISILSGLIFLFVKNANVNIQDVIKVILFKSVLDMILITMNVMIGELYFISYIILYNIPIHLTMFNIRKYFECFFADYYNIFNLLIIFLIAIFLLAKIASKGIIKYVNRQ